MVCLTELFSWKTTMQPEQTWKGSSFYGCKRLALAMLGLAWLGCSAQAQALSGEINFNGGAILDSTLGNASSFSSYFGPSGTGSPEVSGTLSGVYLNVTEATPVTFLPFTFNPGPTAGTGSASLWSFTTASGTYHFDITSVSSATYYQNSSYLNLSGNGVAYVPGHAPTPATWYITDTGSGSPNVTFSAGVTIVPEPSVLPVASVGMLFLVLMLPRFRCKKLENLK